MKNRIIGIIKRFIIETVEEDVRAGGRLYMCVFHDCVKIEDIQKMHKRLFGKGKGK